MKKFLLRTTLCALFLSFSVSSQAINHQDLKKYAASLQGLKGRELKKALFDLARKNLRTLQYGSGMNATWDGFYDTDRIPETNECRNRYSHFKFNFGNRGASISGMNIEHSFPKSWWGGAKIEGYRDLFNLYPCDEKTNTYKNNYPMGEVKHVTNTYAGEGFTKIGSGNAGNKQNVMMWEPGEEFKGEFSRSYMYMATTYADYHWVKTGLQTMEDGQYPSLRQWAQDLYRKWSKEDKVDKVEIDRNNAAYERQKNRNLYIDYPYLAEYVWGDSVNVAFNPNTSISSADNDERYHTVYLNEKAPDVYAPEFTPSAGTYTAPLTVKIACKTAGAKIYYTLDGSNPNAQSTPYKGEFKIETTTTVRAIAINGDKQSSIATAVYTIATEQNSYIFSKITAQPQDGKKYLIVINNNGLKAMKPLNKEYGYPEPADVTETKNVIVQQNETLAYTFTAVAGGFKIQDNNGKYLSQNAGYKTIATVKTEDEAAVWKIEPRTDGTYTIQSVATKNTMQYSVQYKSFGCYETPSAKDIYPMLYQEGKAGTAGIENVSTTKKVENNIIYNLQGVQMPKNTKLQPGIYIKNGKKFVVK